MKLNVGVFFGGESVEHEVSIISAHQAMEALDKNKYKGQSILNIVDNMKNDCIDKVITNFCVIWYASKEDVMYAATHYRNGEIPNESAIKATIDYTSYKAENEKALPKFKYYALLMSELKKILEEEIKPLINH